jgi:hypothetical protein
LVWQIRGEEVVHEVLASNASSDSWIVPPGRGNLSVCVRPFLGPFGDPLQMAQFILYYTIAGAQHFTFYDPGGLNPAATRILRLAQAAGVSLEILPWNEYHDLHEGNQVCLGFVQVCSVVLFRLPEAPDCPMQFGAITACVLWNMHRYKYVAIVDVDEYVISRQYLSLVDVSFHAVDQTLDRVSERMDWLAGCGSIVTRESGVHRLYLPAACPPGGPDE